MLIYKEVHPNLDYHLYKVVQVFLIDLYLQVINLNYFLQHLNVLNLIGSLRNLLDNYMVDNYFILVM